MTSFTKLYENLLPKFKNFDIPLMTVEEVEALLYDYLVPAITKFHICRTDLNKRNNVEKYFYADLTDEEVEILSNYMLIGYTDSEYIQTPTLLKVNLSSSDFNAFSPANMLNKLMDMHDYYIQENDTWLSRYAWKNAYKRGMRLGSGYRKHDE